MNTKIYLVRHGEAENPEKVNYGRLPGFGLSRLGIEQAEKLKKIFSGKKVSAIYSSPLLRTKQTATIIANGKLKVSYSKNLLEVDFGKLEGKPLAHTLNQRKTASSASNFPKESYLAVQKRMVGEIFRIAKRNPGKNILVLSHADPILTARLFFENKPLANIEKLPAVNGSITTIVFDNELNCKSIDYKNLIGAKKDF